MADTNLRLVSGGLIFAAGLCLATSFASSSLHVATPSAVKAAPVVPVARRSQARQQAQAPQYYSPLSSSTVQQQSQSGQGNLWIAATGLAFSVAGLVFTLFRKNETTVLLAETGVKAEPAPWTAPKLSDALKNDAARRKAEALSTQLPTFWQVREDLSKVPKADFEKVFASYKGSTGALLSAAKTEEYYAITWTSPKKQIYELPTGGAAEMDEGLNINYFARKEQCLALGAQLRTFKPRMDNYAIYRVFPNGETQYLHPKDGVFPEKVNEGRLKANHNPRSIGENVDPGSVKFEAKAPKDVATEGAVAMFAETGEKTEKAVWKAPTLADVMKNAAAVQRAKETATQFPTFWDVRADLSKVPKDKFADVFASYKGSTGALLSAATTEEKYVIAWTSTKKQIFELPTGGAAEMEAGENVLFFSRKEQCLALGAQLRTAFKPRIDDFKIFRVFPNGEAQYLHPKDGVFPEKVNEGRQKANHNPRSIGENVEPGSVKFEAKAPKDVATEGAIAMFAETAEKPVWTTPKLVDAMKDSAAVQRAEALATQFPTFWDVRADLSKVPKEKFADVFASYKGSTGALLSAANTEEKYVIAWTSPKKQIFELPTGGAAEMEAGENILFFSRKEQCLALGAQLRTAFKPKIDNFKIFRVFPNGEAQYLHPKDGVFPEKVNEGRQKANHNPRSIGENVEPGAVKFEAKAPKDVATEGAVAMFAETGAKTEKPAWTTPSLADVMKNTAAVQRATATATQFPTFWDVRADLSKVPKEKFADVFAGYKGSTGALLSAATTEEKYVIAWTSPKKQIFELPTGGAAEMEAGENVLFFSRKEQCLALGAQLRTAFKPKIDDFKIFRVFPNGEAQYLHPKDGVFPEKVNEGRQKANHNPRSIGENVEPGSVKFEGKAPKDI